MKWTKAYRRSHGKELMFDKSLEFEKRREEPVRYNRDLYVKTVQAMKKVEGIRARREKAFIQNRIKQAKKNNREIVEKELMRHIDLIKNPELKSKIKGMKTKAFEEEVAKTRSQTRLQKELQKNKKIENEIEGSEDDVRDSDDSGDEMSEEEIIN
jgi:large subunit ribosomal protein L24e